MLRYHLQRLRDHGKDAWALGLTERILDQSRELVQHVASVLENRRGEFKRIEFNLRLFLSQLGKLKLDELYTPVIDPLEQSPLNRAFLGSVDLSQLVRAVKETFHIVH